MTARLDKDLVKQAARGRWPEILERVGGFSADVLDPAKEHPCPKCGGTTRARLVDEEAGAFRCSHCFSKDCGDGLAAVKWMLNCTFPEAVEKVASYLGMTPPGNGKPESNGRTAANGKPAASASPPDKNIEFRPWSSILVQHVFIHKPGLSEDALLAVGARLARHFNHSVIALPILGESLDTESPNGYVLFDVFGKLLPTGEGSKPTKIKTVGTSGLVGSHSVKLATADDSITAVKCEGVTDMLAAIAATPQHLRDKLLFVTNAGGCSESPKWMANVLARFNCIVVGDADKPGQKGAERWACEIAAEQTENRTTRNIILPYPIEETKGHDLRDWLNEGQKIEEFLELADATEPTVGVKRRKRKEVDISNFEKIIVQTPDGQEEVTVPIPMGEIIDGINLLTNGWPRRVDNVLFVHDQEHGIGWFDRRGAEGLFGFLRRRFNVDWRKGSSLVSQGQLFAELERTAAGYDAIELLQHEPPIERFYYACNVSSSGGDGQHLRWLLDRFRPETTIDRDLIQAAMMTAFWGGPPGCRPAFVITSDAGRGAGKTKLAEIIAYLAGGFIDVSAGEEISVLKQRFLSPEGMTKRVAILDNVKTMRLSWAELESLITAPIISGKRMYVGEGQRPNVITWIVTLNGVSLATDMAQRSVIIKITKGANSGPWYEETMRYIDRHRNEIVGDLIATLRAEPSDLDSYSRWAAWESAVLRRLPEPSEAQAVIAERQGKANCEQDEAEIVEEFFAEELWRLKYNPRTCQVRIPTAIAAEWFCRATNERIKTAAVSRRLNQLASEGQIVRLSADPSRTHGRCYVWTGESADIRNEPIVNDLRERIAERAADA